MKIYLLQGTRIKTQIAFSFDTLLQYLEGLVGAPLEKKEPYTAEDIVIHIFLLEHEVYQITEFTTLDEVVK